ncbi:hypothetical protein NNJEOMEG_00195 [Fundidesulfovibrio magnetotacticus]|uniref:Uncharacterized protein n=1 Tax=Fundidesulfovibrio magnetotacticus TaxID=2730080 RepID=A0A6V8LMZ1_9BACT|nr:hypothetical protein [Fundidesulfovibrio magnetotacticus]GFK92370.1 hypothetical protein NNJEOMEG_00195 [Fundidesulfovibrio magnetotacticus]
MGHRMSPGTAGFLRSGRGWRPLAVLAALTFLLALFPADAPPAAPSGPDAPGPVERRVLILCNTATQNPLTNTLAYHGFQTVLNYLGLVAVSFDLAERPLPGPEEMRDVRAVIVSLNTSEVYRAGEYHEWLHRQLDAGRKLVVLDSLGPGEALETPEGTARFLELYERLGVRYKAGPVKDRSRLRFTTLDPAMTGYERKHPSHPSHYEHITPLRPDVRVHVGVSTDRPEDGESPMVFTSDTGGVIFGNEFAYWLDPLSTRSKWYIDPFVFMARALDLPVYPVPDPTTLNGRRVAFSHVDADGFSGVSLIDRTRTCAAVLSDEVLSKVDFPVSFSVIEAEISPDFFGNAKLMDTARDILALPNVEPASHTFSHPFFWNPGNKDQVRYTDRFAFDIPGYALDPWREIAGSVDFVNNNLVPEGKRCRLLFWSGACDPLPEHQAIARDNGLLAINGGDTLWDAAHDSLFGVKPLHRHLGGGLHQIHIGQANDNILTNLWRGPFNGYRNIIETFKRTGSPRRLKPIDIYYHVFSTEKLGGLNALKEVYAWVAAQPVAPLFTSAYVQSVQDWMDVHLERLGPDLFSVADYGLSLTLRLPADGPAPDMSRCENVLGYDRQPEGLYVHLAPGQKRAVLALAAKDDAPAGAPFLRAASGYVRDWTVTERVLTFTTQFFTRNGKVTLGGLRPGVVYWASGPALGGRSVGRAASEEGTVSLEGLASGALTLRFP